MKLHGCARCLHATQLIAKNENVEASNDITQIRLVWVGSDAIHTGQTNDEYVHLMSETRKFDANTPHTNILIRKMSTCTRYTRCLLAIVTCRECAVYTVQRQYHLKAHTVRELRMRHAHITSAQNIRTSSSIFFSSSTFHFSSRAVIFSFVLFFFDFCFCCKFHFCAVDNVEFLILH